MNIKKISLEDAIFEIKELVKDWDEVMYNILSELYITRQVIVLRVIDVFRYDIRVVILKLNSLRYILEEKYDIGNYNLLKYNNMEFTLYIKEGKMKKSSITLEIPYGKRSQYIDFIVEANKLIELEGMFALCVNNNPYELTFHLCIETDNIQEVRKLAKEYDVSEIKKGKPWETYVVEMAHGKWNIETLTTLTNVEYIKGVFNRICFFKEEEAFSDMNYDFVQDGNAVFISYCHKDSKKVDALCDMLKESGIPFWRDMYDIDFGESILDSIDEAIKKHKVFLICISENTKNARFAKEELKTLYSKYIVDKSKGKSVIPLRLDESEPKDILDMLMDYKYVNFYDKTDMQNLMIQLRKLILKNKF